MRKGRVEEESKKRDREGGSKEMVSGKDLPRSELLLTDLRS